MAQIVQTILACDWHDETVEAIGTITFSYEGKTYQFEACQEHSDEFDAVMQEWISGARLESTNDAKRSYSTPRATKTRTTRGRRTATIARQRERRHDIREWARENGFEVSDRGKIPQEAVIAYAARVDGGAVRARRTSKRTTGRRRALQRVA